VRELCHVHIHWGDTIVIRVPTPSGKSRKVLDFFLKIPGPGKSCKLKLEVLENPGKISLKMLHFHRLKWKTNSSSISPSLC